MIFSNPAFLCIVSACCRLIFLTTTMCSLTENKFRGRPHIAYVESWTPPGQKLGCADTVDTNGLTPLGHMSPHFRIPMRPFDTEL